MKNKHKKKCILIVDLNGQLIKDKKDYYDNDVCIITCKSHMKHDLDLYDSLIISLDKNHEDIFHFYFDYFKNKPVLTTGYACIFLSKYYNCHVINNCDNYDNIISDCVIKTDTRYKLHSNIDNVYNKVILNNDNNTIIIPDDSDNKSMSCCISGSYKYFIDTSYRFMNKKHYGILFNLNDSSIGESILQNFITRI